MRAAPTPVTPEETQAAEELVRRHLGFPSLRPGQAETIARVRRGEDVLAILPTGGGKSVCYQLPGVLGKGVTLVVSPLVALMKDQLDSLPPAMRAASCALTGDLPARELRALVEEVAQGRYRLVYAAPERLRQAGLLQALRSAGVARLVVDEAHCVSTWGHDFRPDYLALPRVRRALGSPPVLAVTATAAPRVMRDIQERLGPLAVVRASVSRPNLRLEAILAKNADEKLAHLLQLCRETKGPGIVYCSSRQKTEQLAAALQQAGVDALAYHAGMPDRGARQDAFMRGDVGVLVSTVAFGMGVDKGDVRFILHHDPSGSLESYVQEAGRAGRDGGPARCVVLATSADGASLRQRARADLPSAHLVEAAWGLVLRAAAEDGYAVVEPESVDALAPDDEVKPRVALSVLQEAGAVERLADAARFFRLADGREATLFDLARTLAVPPEDVETALLDRGEPFQAAGRVMLFRVKGAPDRVEDVLESYAKRAQERGEEMMAYVRETGCRHAHLRRYFGEEPGGPCGNCDNCLGVRHEPPEEAGDDQEAARAVLLALSGVRGLGETNLVYMLRGDPLAPPWTDGKPGAGALGFRSASAIKRLVRRLEEQGLVARETLPHGGVTLKLAPKGAEVLASEGAVLPEPEPAAPARAGGAQASGEGGPLFAALREWRLARSQEDGVPPYVVAHDQTLRDVEAARPRTLDGLRGVRGMGPKKVERYGEEILAVVARFL